LFASNSSCVTDDDVIENMAGNIVARNPPPVIGAMSARDWKRVTSAGEVDRAPDADVGCMTNC
jgi:hypothetical protein